MRQPTWQEIEAEAQRRGRLESDTTGRRWTLAEKIVEVINEGWSPPEPVVDPDVWAFLEWWGSEDGNADPKHAYLAGARMAREQEQERANHPVAFTVRVMAGVFNSLDHAKREARAALDKYRGEP